MPKIGGSLKIQGNGSAPGGPGAFITLSLRIRKFSEPELFELVQAVEAGRAGSFLRSAMETAVRVGALSPAGYVPLRDEQLRVLEVQLQIERDHRRQLETELEQLRSGQDLLSGIAAPPPSPLPVAIAAAGEAHPQQLDEQAAEGASAPTSTPMLEPPVRPSAAPGPAGSSAGVSRFVSSVLSMQPRPADDAKK